MATDKVPVMEVDTLVIGAGLIGSSVAMHLGLQGAGNVRVIDFDLEGSLSSSELNAGGVRASWNQPINIIASKLSIDYFAQHAQETGYRPCGYLWLHTPERLPNALRARERQQELGWASEVWDAAELRRRIPFIDKTDDLGGAIFVPRDGLLNPNLLKLHYRAKARERGVVFDDGTLVTSARHDERGVTVEAIRFDAPLTPEAKAGLLARQAPATPHHLVRYRARRVVNCAGAWAPFIAHILGYPCPSHPTRRQVSIFQSRDVDLSPYGMMVDTSGVYFHPEGGNGLAGWADPHEPIGVNFAYDGERFFEERIWPALYERSSGFERLKHVTGWGGIYEVSPDESAIIGPVLGGAAEGRLFEAHSFSGHGVMHSYAAGLALAEQMERGRYETWDASALEGSRFAAGREIRETLII